MAKVETLRAKMLRKALLLSLQAAQSGVSEGWLNVRMAWGCVHELDEYALAEVSQELKYLAGKGYAEARDLRATKYDPPNRSYRITPRGIDLVEQSIPVDPGVEDDRA